VIKPTIGRVVWLHRPDSIDQSQPEAALVTYVHSDTCINVAGFTANGSHFSSTSVYLDQGDTPRPEWAILYAEWMPYQKGQAAKTEALESALGSAVPLGAPSAA
jgi:hypothetical protein